MGLVVVSHSRPLAIAAVELAGQMLQSKGVRIAVAAGLDDGTLGTDAVAISEAIAAADDGDAGGGVVVLMDLGSAVLSAELALDLLDHDVRSRVLLCPAPLVEGLVVAAVAAAAGAGPEEVASEARNALAGKLSQLAHNADRPRSSPRVTDRFARITMAGAHGLHARPAAWLVVQLRELDADVHLRNVTTGSDWVSATSLSQLATLGAVRDHEVEVRAAGPHAREAINLVQALAAGAAGGTRAPMAPARRQPIPVPASPGPLPASPGIGIGPAWQMRRGLSLHCALTTVATGVAAREWTSLTDARAAVRVQLTAVRDRVASELTAHESSIFDAHLLLLDDPELLDRARDRVEAGRSAAAGWAEAIGLVAERFDRLDDDYLRARAADVRAVGEQVIRQLLGTSGGSGMLAVDGVLVAADLSPAEAAMLDPTRTAGAVLAFGGPTSHTAILARARGIPLVVGAGQAVLDIADGTMLAVDGSTGEIVIDPTDDVVTRFRSHADVVRTRRAEALLRAGDRADTRDGVQILVGANLGSVVDAHAALAAGADLAGLVRTEFLFTGRHSAPDVDEQEAVYRELADAFGGRRLTIRTLDAGGDKPLPYLPAPAESNPFLGLRGLRFSLANPALLADQLQAVVRVAHDVPVSLMFPMVSRLSEFLEARRMLDDVIRASGRRRPDGMMVGIMVEVPAAALKAATFAPHVEFMSIGTNDLAQYTMAADRGNSWPATLSNPLDPGVLRLIDATCRGAGRNTPVAVCGELAADEGAAGLLAGLGVRGLSVTPVAVPIVKDVVRSLDLVASEQLARRALLQPDADAVRAMLT